MKLLLRFSRALCAVCCAAPLTNAVAQEPRRLATLDSIPVELATALVASGGFGGEPIILVGALPEWFTSRVVVPAEGELDVQRRLCEAVAKARRGGSRGR